MGNELYNEQIAVEIGLFVYRQATPSWKIDESVIDFTDLTYIESGSALYFIDGKPIEVHTGDLLCIPKGTLRSAVSVPENLASQYSINFQLFNFKGEQPVLPFPIISKLGLRLDLLSMYKELNTEWLRQEPGHILKSHAILLLIIQRLCDLLLYDSDPAKRDPRIQEVIRYVTENYARPIGISDAAAAVSLSPVYLGALFKAQTRESFRRYLTSIRLNYAENMLVSGEYTIGEVATMCGFSDIFYFSKVFKENRGISPSHILPGKVKASP